MAHEAQHRSIDRGGFYVSTTKAPILNASELDSLNHCISVPAPEICFGNNALALRHAAFAYTFDAPHALAEVDPTGEDRLQVAHAGEWAKSRNFGEGDGVKVVQKWDWTYTTTHMGRLEPVASTSKLAFEPAPRTHPGIPLKRLASQDEPILFFEEVTLFEDELHDCGMANLVVKVRVMPSFVFILSRFFLRVDRVLFRIFDVRLYHAFGTKEVIREVRGREAAYDDVKRRLPADQPDDLTPLTDSTWVANVIGMLEETRPAAAGPAPPEPQSVRNYLAQQNIPSSLLRTGMPGASERTGRVLPDGSSAPASDTVVADQEPATPPARKPWRGICTTLEILRLS